MSAADLAILLRLKDEASSEFEGVKSRFGGFGGIIAGGIAAAGAAIATGVAVGVKSAGDLEQSVANISTIKPDIDTTAIFGSLNEMTTRIPQSAAQLGDSLYNVFSSMSVSSEEALGLVETFAQGAVGAQTDAATFGTSIMGVLNAYGLAASDASHVSDVFFNTVAAGVVTGQELASSLGPVTQSAKAAGVGIDELGAMIAGVTREGGPAAQNINNLNNFLSKVTTKEAQAQLNALGVSTTDATGKFRPTTDVLTDLKEKLGGMTEAGRANALQAIFPDAQARQGAATLMSQLDMVKEAVETNKTSSGAAAAAYSTMSATFNSQTTLLMNALMSILTMVGAQILPVISPLVTALAQSLPGAFAAISAAVGPVVASLSETLVPAFQALMASLPTVVGLLQDLFNIFSGGDAFDTAAEALDQLFGPAVTDMILDFTALAGDAFRAVADAVMQAMGGIVAWFQENWPLIQQVVQQTLENMAAFWEAHGASIVTIVQAAWTILTTTIGGALDVIGSVIRAALQLLTGDWQGAWETLAGLVERQTERMRTIFSAALDAILAVLDIATGGLLTKIGTWMSDTQTAISDGWQAATDAITGAWDAITSAVDGAISAVTSALDGAWSAIGSALQGAWDGFKSTIQGVLDGIKSAISTVWNQIPEDIRQDCEKVASALVEKGQAWVTNITTAGSNMLTAIQTKLTEMVTAVTTWATNFLAPITGLVSTATTEATSVGTGMLTSLQTQFTAIVTAVTTWVTNFLAPVTALAGQAMTAATSVGQAILTAIQTKLAEVVGHITTWAGSVVSAISGLVGQVTGAAQSVGNAIVQGVVSGIQAMAGRIGEVLAGIARGALQSAKNALDIRSPSKVFADEVGQPIVQGILSGLDAMQTPLDRALGGLVQPPGLVPSYIGAGAVGAGGGRYDTLEIQVRYSDADCRRIFVRGRDLATSIYGGNNV